MILLVSIGLILFSLAVFKFRRRLKNAASSTDSISVKLNLFWLVFLAPFCFLAGVFFLYNDVTFKLNKDTLVEQCINNIGKKAELIGVDQEYFSVIVEFRDKTSGETFWCENDGESTKYL